MADPAAPPAPPAPPAGTPPAPGAAPPAAPPAGTPPAGAPPAGAPPAGAPPAGAPPAGGGDPFATFHTKEAFDERLDRATRAKMRELGVDPEQAKKDSAELAAMKEAEEKRRAAEMSDLEKAQAEAEKAKVEKAAAEAEKKKAERAYEIARLGAAHQVPDLEYLAFRIRSLPEGEDRDEWLTKLLEDPTERVRFGVTPAGDPPAGAKPGEKKTTTTTTPKGGGGAPPPGGTGGGAPGEGEKTAMKMTKREFEAHKRQKYGGGGANVRKGYQPPPQ